MEVGDILVYAYSYNARYPHFVRITRMTNSFIWVEDVPKKWYTHDGFGQNGQVVPNFKAQTTPVKGRFKIRNNSYFGECTRINGCLATIWDGTPQDEYTD